MTSRWALHRRGQVPAQRGQNRPGRPSPAEAWGSLAAAPRPHDAAPAVRRPSTPPTAANSTSQPTEPKQDQVEQPQQHGHDHAEAHGPTTFWHSAGAGRRGFYGYQFWQQVRATGAQLLWRITTQTDLPVQESLPDGSYRSSLAPAHWRSDIKRGKRRRIDRYEIPVRVVDYTITNRGTGPAGGASGSAIGEIVQRLNPPRRHRSCPRVVKRGRLKNQRAKRATDRNIAHDSPAEIHLLQRAT